MMNSDLVQWRVKEGMVFTVGSVIMSREISKVRKSAGALGNAETFEILTAVGSVTQFQHQCKAGKFS